LPEASRFLIVGIINTVIGYFLFALSLLLFSDTLQDRVGLINDNYYLIVQWISWIICVPISTFTMKHFAFESSGHYVREVTRAYGVYFPIQIISNVLLKILVFALAYLAGTPVQITLFERSINPLVLIAQFMTIGVGAILSYVGLKYFTFRKDDEQPSTD